MAENPQDPNTGSNAGPEPSQQPGTPPPGGPGGEVSKDARMMGMLCHLLAFAGFVFPFGNILGPLIIWLVKKEDHPFIDDQGKESLNFQITMTIAAIVLAIVTCLVAGLGAVVVGIFMIVMVIIASLKANEGVWYRYPLTLRLIK